MSPRGRDRALDRRRVLPAPTGTVSKIRNASPGTFIMAFRHSRLPRLTSSTRQKSRGSGLLNCFIGSVPAGLPHRLGLLSALSLCNEKKPPKPDGDSPPVLICPD